MNRVRLYDPVSHKYLHVSGEHPTDDKAWAWAGSPLQTGVLRRRALNARKPWPYVVVPVVQSVKSDTSDANSDSEAMT